MTATTNIPDDFMKRVAQMRYFQKLYSRRFSNAIMRAKELHEALVDCTLQSINNGDDFVEAVRSLREAQKSQHRDSAIRANLEKLSKYVDACIDKHIDPEKNKLF